MGDDLILEILLVPYLIFQQLKGLELLEILELSKFNSLLDHVLERGHLLETIDNVHQVVSQVDEFILKNKPLLIQLVDLPQVLS